jgi:hypothetical protein
MIRITRTRRSVSPTAIWLINRPMDSLAIFCWSVIALLGTGYVTHCIQHTTQTQADQPLFTQSRLLLVLHSRDDQVG